MAEVKLKNGYLRISVSLFENLYFRSFSKRELLIISLILRLSYGYHKKTAIIKPKTWFSVCGLYQPDINKILNGLIAKNVIKYLGNNIYSLNKNYDDWSVNFSKNFDVNKLNILKMFQQTEQNSIQNDSNKLSKNIVKNYKKEEQNTIKEDSKLLNDSEILSNNIVNCYDKKTDIEQNTIKKDSKKLSKDIVKNYKENTENKDGEKVLDGFKNNKNNKDNTNNINIYNSNSKNFDPYLNNPIIEKFKTEYQKRFKRTRCYLDNFQINKLIEINTDNPDFVENIPLIIEKFSKIEFSNGIGKPSLKWLINEGNWASILNGERDQNIKDENTQKDNFDLGIPLWSED